MAEGPTDERLNKKEPYHPSTRLYYTPAAVLCCDAPAAKRDRSPTSEHPNADHRGWWVGGLRQRARVRRESSVAQIMSRQ